MDVCVHPIIGQLNGGRDLCRCKGPIQRRTLILRRESRNDNLIIWLDNCGSSLAISVRVLNANGSALLFLASLLFSLCGCVRHTPLSSPPQKVFYITSHLISLPNPKVAATSWLEL